MMRSTSRGRFTVADCGHYDCGYGRTGGCSGSDEHQDGIRKPNERRPKLDGHQWARDAMTLPWHAMANDVIGGWCVMATPEPPSRAQQPEVADFCSESHAWHIAELHNRWLARELAYRGRNPGAELPPGQSTSPTTGKPIDMDGRC